MLKEKHTQRYLPTLVFLAAPTALCFEVTSVPYFLEDQTTWKIFLETKKTEGAPGER